MKIKVFTLHFDPELGGFDDRALSAFVADKTVLAVDQHFFVHEQRPLWSLLVSYRESVAQPSDRRGQPARDERVDWRSSLPAEARPYFDLLRSWRNARAQRTGKPAYVLLTNRQLAQLARQRPTTLAALGELEGVGEARDAADACARRCAVPGLPCVPWPGAPRWAPRPPPVPEASAHPEAR